MTEKKISITESQFEELTAATAAYKARLEQDRMETEQKLRDIERRQLRKGRRKEKAKNFFKILGLIMLFCIILPAMIAMYSYTGVCAVLGGIAWIGIIQLIYAGISTICWLIAVIAIFVKGLTETY